jgi:hypothetical protein
VSERADDDLRQRLAELETLIRAMEEGPETPVRTRARQIVRAALDLHTGALARMLEIATTAAGPPVVEAWVRDPLVSSLLLLHGLHPLALGARVRAAVDDLTPTLGKHGARVARVAVDDGAVRVVIERDAGRGGWPAAALRSRIEASILAAAPDAISLEIDVPSDAERPGFVPVEHVRLRARAREAGA